MKDVHELKLSMKSKMVYLTEVLCFEYVSRPFERYTDRICSFCHHNPKTLALVIGATIFVGF